MGQICSFCGSKEEAKKSSPIADASSEDVLDSSSHHPQQRSHPGYNQTPPDGGSHHLPPSHEHDPSLAAGGGSGGDPNQHSNDLQQLDEGERQRRLAQYRLEQAELARREAIVTAASQAMVPVGAAAGSHPSSSGHQGMSPVGAGGMMNRGGIYSYYDPAYAAAAAQDILTSAARSGGLVFADDKATRMAWNAAVMGRLPVPSRVRWGEGCRRRTYWMPWGGVDGTGYGWDLGRPEWQVAVEKIRNIIWTIWQMPFWEM